MIPIPLGPPASRYLLLAKVVAVLLVLAAAFGSGWAVNGWRLGAEMAQERQGQAEAIAKGVKDALETTAAMQAKKDRALSAARDRELALSAAAADAAAESNRLRDELAAERTRIAVASCPSVRDHANAISSVFGECQSAYSEMAGIADRASSDVRTLIEAWPTLKEQKHDPR